MLKSRIFASMFLIGALSLAGCGERPDEIEQGAGTGDPDGGETVTEPETGGEGEEESEFVGSEDADVTLQIMIWNNSPEAVQAETRIFEEFYEDTGIAVEVIHTPWGEYNERFMTMAAGGNAPDLVWVQTEGFATFAENDLLMDITDHLDELDLDEFMPGVLELGQMDDQQYALIRDRSTRFFAYNKDMFDEAGVDYPEPDWTIDDFAEISQQLTIEEDGRVVQFAHEEFIVKDSLASFGATIMDPETAEITFDSPEALESQQWRQDLINEYNVIPTGAQTEGLSNLFISGTAAMRMAGPWNWIEFDDNVDFEWDIVPLPQGNEDAYHRANYLPIAITTQTDHPDEAWELLKFLGYGRGQDIQGEYVSAIPVVERNVGDLLDFAGAPEGAHYLVEVLEEGNVILDTPYHPDVPEIENRYHSEIERLNLSNEDVQEPLEALADQLRSEFGLD